MSFNSYAKLSNRKYLEVIKSCIDVGLPVRAVKSSPTSVYFSSVGEYTCVNTRIDTAEWAEVYSLSESPFCLLQEEVRTLQHFTFHACN